jgi:hypothetical protein
MESNRSYVVTVMLVAATAGMFADAVLGVGGEPFGAPQVTLAAASAESAAKGAAEGAVYFPSQYTLNAPEPAGEHIQAF